MEATNTTSEELVFDAKALAPVALFMAQNDIRYYLRGIHVSPHPQRGVYISASDGHRIAVWHDPYGYCDRARILTITPALVSASKKRHKTELRMPLDKRISYEKGRLVLAQWNTLDGKPQNGDTKAFPRVELHIQPGKADIDGTYPQFWRVVPKEEDLVSGLRGAIQAKYIKDLGAASALLSGDGRGGIWHYSSGEEGRGGVLTRFSAANNFMVITMPYRISEEASILPEGFIRPAIIPDDPTAPRKPAA